MAKPITLSQLEELKRFNNNLSLYSSQEYKEYMADNALQMLNDIEFFGAFHRKLMVELGIYYFHKDKYNFNMINFIISNAVKHYEEQIN